jgi:hypothetical protein
MSVLRAAGLVAASMVLSGQVSAPKYAAGQVWEYRTRPQDAGSLLKIQQIEGEGQDRVYHVSIVRVRFATSGVAGTLGHIPVSNAALDASVTKIAPAKAEFPKIEFQEGIAEWKKAQGGVFTIPVAQIVGIIDDQISRPPATTSQ